MPNTLEIQYQGAVATVTLRRPEVHNAFNGELLQELTDAFQEIAAAPETRVVVLAAEGKSFCAGADLNWMRTVAGYRFDENVAEAMRLAGALKAIYDCPKPVIGRIQGSAFGGGVGLTAVCDLAVAVESAVFSLSEVKLGLIPAVISPFILTRVPPGHVRRYSLTGERFTAAEAHRIGLVVEVAAGEEALDEVVNGWTSALLANAPGAMADCKRLLDTVAGPVWDEALAVAARYNAERRASDEGQEGMRAFLEKRPPSWRREV